MISGSWENISLGLFQEHRRNSWGVWCYATHHLTFVRISGICSTHPTVEQQTGERVVRAADLCHDMWRRLQHGQFLRSKISTSSSCSALPCDVSTTWLQDRWCCTLSCFSRAAPHLLCEPWHYCFCGTYTWYLWYLFSTVGRKVLHASAAYR